MENKIKNLIEALDFKLEFTSEENYALLKEVLRKKIDEVATVQQADHKQQKQKLLQETQYEHATFAFDDDEVEKNGSCVLTTKEQADLLMKRMNTYWETHHKITWNGPGKYLLIPSKDYDRCGDMILTVSYEKEI